MRCPNCQHLTGNRRHREPTICPYCRYEFVCDPGQDRGFNDERMLIAIRDASRDGRQDFTLDDLYQAYCRPKLRAPRGLKIRHIVAIGASALVLRAAGIFDGQIALAVGSVIFYLILGLVIEFAPNAKPPKHDFEAKLRRWIEHKGPILGLQPA